MSRLLLIGLDGADLDVVRPFAEAGHLPHLHDLMKKGAFGPLRSTYPAMSPPAWTTFMTGKNPGKHGVFDFTVRKPDSYEVEFVNARFRRAVTMWRLMSDAGKRVCVLSVPITFPPEKLNGIQVSGIDTPGVTGGLAEPNAMHPPELHAELTEKLGGYLVSPNLKGIDDASVDQFVAAACRTIDRKMETAQYLYEKERWDCFMITIGETDGISHRLWHYHDKACPMGDAASRAHTGTDPLLAIYQRIDTHVGKLLASASADSTVFVMSDHGHAGNSDKAVYLNRFLKEKGYLGFATGQGGRLMSSILGFAKKMGTKNLIPLKYRKKLFRATPLAGMVESYLRFSRMDWARTRAYSDETPYYPNVWINVKGRDPQGCVEPGAEFEQVRDAVIRDLESWTDPFSGQRMVKKAHRREQIYHGEFMAGFPDIVVEWNLDGNYSYVFRTSKSEDQRPPVLKLEGEERAKAKSGDHRDDGLLIAAGPLVAPVHAVQNARIEDLAPTFLYSMGLPVPEDMDGRVLTDLLDPEHVKAHPVQRSKPTTLEPPTDSGAGDYSQAEEEEVRKRLQGLGYLE